MSRFTTMFWMLSGVAPVRYGDEEKIRYADWLLATKSERGEIQTTEQYAEANGMSAMTLYRWKVNDPVVTKALEDWRKTVKRNYHTTAHTLLEVATDSKNRNVVAAARLLAELTDEIGPTKIELNGKVALFEFLATAVSPSGALPLEPGETDSK